MSGLPGTIENALQLLTPDSPGQFYVDRASARVHYVPHPGEDPRYTKLHARRGWPPFALTKGEASGPLNVAKEEVSGPFAFL